MNRISAPSPAVWLAPPLGAFRPSAWRDPARALRAWLSMPAKSTVWSSLAGGRVESRPLAADRAPSAAEVRPALDDLANRFRQSIVPELDAAYSFARFLCKDGEVAHDIVQDAFLKAFRAYGGFKGGDARAWVFAIVRNCYRDWMLGRRRVARHEMKPVDDEGEDPAIERIASEQDTPEASLMRKSEAEAVRFVLMAMPRPLREILVLREIEDLSYREIATITTLPIGTVMSRLARARKEFARAWLGEGSEGAVP